MYCVLEKKDKTAMAWKDKRLMPTPHLHEHLEIIFMKRGKTLAVADDKKIMMEDGDLYIAFPNQIHYYFDDPDVKQEVWILIVSQDICPEFNDELKHFLPASPVLKNAGNHPRLVSAFSNIIDIHIPESKYSESEMKGYALVLLSEIFQHLSLGERKKADPNLISDIIRYCYQNYAENITLHSLAKAFHVSHYYISHIFNERLHTAFRDYINHLRISKACTLLKTTESSITNIAYEVGYNSSRTFNRCFMNIKGMSPKEYRAKKGTLS